MNDGLWDYIIESIVTNISLIDSSFYGCLVEGTFMNPDCCGCHNKDYIYSPSLSRLHELISTRGVRMLNVAPEMGNAEDTIDVIRAATREGITVGTGHAKPSARTLRNAVEAGCKYIIHLGNASGSSLKAFGDGGMIVRESIAPLSH